MKSLTTSFVFNCFSWNYSKQAICILLNTVNSVFPLTCRVICGKKRARTFERKFSEFCQYTLVKFLFVYLSVYLRLWLVNIRSRAVRHNWVLKHKTRKPRPPERHRSKIKVNVARCVAVRNVTRFIFVIFWKDILLKLILNLFQEESDLNVKKYIQVVYPFRPRCFIRHLTTRQGSSFKNRPLIIFVD